MKNNLVKFLIPVVFLFVLTSCASLNRPSPSYEELPLLQRWGLGRIETEHVSLNRDYNWYIDQRHTGLASESNCGPSCTIMAARWYDKDFPKTVEEARLTFRENGGWWYIQNIYSFLVNNKIPAFINDTVSPVVIKDYLDNGSILIVNIHTRHISYNSNDEQRTGKFYQDNTGHFIIIKGYRVVDGQTYYEVYDPNTWDMYYRDGTQKGRDRYYLANRVLHSMTQWEKRYIVIPQKN